MISWNGFALIGEAARNLLAQRWQSLVLCIVMFAVLLTIALEDLHTATGLERANRQLILAGATTVKVVANGGSDALPAAECARLSGQDGVVAAGGIGAVQTVYASSSPALGFWEAPAVGDVVVAATGHRSDQRPGAGLVVSSELASQLGVARGSYLSIAGATYRVALVGDLGARDPLLGRIALDPVAPSGEIASCYVEFTPSGYAAGVRSLAAAFPGVAGIQIRELVPQGPGTVRPAYEWTTRSSRILWLVGGVSLAGFVLFASRIRRQELALYIVTGTSRSVVVILRILEVQIIAIASVASSISWFALLAELDHADWSAERAGVIALTRTALTAVCLTPVGLIWLLRTDLSSILRERAS